MKNGLLTGIRIIRSLCIRVARDILGIGQKLSERKQSILILGSPGWGKTTLLRDIARCFSQSNTVCVVDERQELFPDGFTTGKRMDILTGCPKKQGIEIVLRTMCPDLIAVDEITAVEDCNALIRAANCGVTLLATAHASGIMDYKARSVYAPLRSKHIFDTFIILHADKTYHTEVAI